MVSTHQDAQADYYISVPADTGFQLSRTTNKCDWTSPPPTSYGSLRLNTGVEFHLIRCSLGTGAATVSVEKGPSPRESVAAWTNVRHSWHTGDPTITYHLNTSIGESMLTDGLSKMETGWDGATATVNFESSSSTGADVVVMGYAASANKCPTGAVACISGVHPSHYPHLPKRKLYVGFPAIKGKIWTNDYSKATGKDKELYYYMPLVLMHEMGHAGGLGHLPFRVGVMSLYDYNGVFSAPTPIDERGMREALESHSH